MTAKLITIIDLTPNGFANFECYLIAKVVLMNQAISTFVASVFFHRFRQIRSFSSNHGDVRGGSSEAPSTLNDLYRSSKCENK